MRTLNKGFTLIELLVVIVIITVVYTLVVPRLSTGKKEETVPRTPVYLKALLVPYHDRNFLELRCAGDRCEKCELFADGESVETDGAFDDLFGSSPVLYRFRNAYLEPQNTRKESCFDYRLYPNGAGSEMLIEWGGRFLLYRPFSASAEVYAALEPAKKALDPAEVLPFGDYQYYGKGE